MLFTSKKFASFSEPTNQISITLSWSEKLAENLQTEDASKIIPEILWRWEGDREDAHLFISLLEEAYFINPLFNLERKFSASNIAGDISRILWVFHLR